MNFAQIKITGAISSELKERGMTLSEYRGATVIPNPPLFHLSSPSPFSPLEKGKPGRPRAGFIHPANTQICHFDTFQADLKIKIHHC